MSAEQLLLQRGSSVIRIVEIEGPLTVESQEEQIAYLMDEAPSEDSYRLGEMKRQEAKSRKDKLEIFFPSTNKYSGSSGLVVLCDWSDLL
jgi:hypothetical protein